MAQGARQIIDTAARRTLASIGTGVATAVPPALNDTISDWEALLRQILRDEQPSTDPLDMAIDEFNQAVYDREEGYKQYRVERPGTMKIDQVIDGDTVRIAGIGTIRLTGVDTREMSEPGGQAAKGFMEALVASGNNFKYHPSGGHDVYGRPLGAFELPDGRTANALVAEFDKDWRADYARRAPTEKQLLELEREQFSRAVMKGLIYPLSAEWMPFGLTPYYDKLQQEINDLQRHTTQWYDQPEQRKRYGIGRNEYAKAVARSGGPTMAGMMVGMLPAAITINIGTTAAFGVFSATNRAQKAWRLFQSGAATDSLLVAGGRLQDGQSRIRHVLENAFLGGVFEMGIGMMLVPTATIDEVGGPIKHAKAVDRIVEMTGRTREQVEDFLNDINFGGGKAVPGDVLDDVVARMSDPVGQPRNPVNLNAAFEAEQAKNAVLPAWTEGADAVRALTGEDGQVAALRVDIEYDWNSVAARIQEWHKMNPGQEALQARQLQHVEDLRAAYSTPEATQFRWQYRVADDGTWELTNPNFQDSWILDVNKLFESEGGSLNLPPDLDIKLSAKTTARYAQSQEWATHFDEQYINARRRAVAEDEPNDDANNSANTSSADTTLDEVGGLDVDGQTRSDGSAGGPRGPVGDHTGTSTSRPGARLRGVVKRCSNCDFEPVEILRVPEWMKKMRSGWWGMSKALQGEGIPFKVGILRDLSAPAGLNQVTAEHWARLSPIERLMVQTQAETQWGMLKFKGEGHHSSYQRFSKRIVRDIVDGEPIQRFPKDYPKNPQWTRRNVRRREQKRQPPEAGTVSRYSDRKTRNVGQVTDDTEISPLTGVSRQYELLSIDPHRKGQEARFVAALRKIGPWNEPIERKLRTYMSVLADKVNNGGKLTDAQAARFPAFDDAQKRYARVREYEGPDPTSPDHRLTHVEGTAQGETAGVISGKLPSSTQARIRALQARVTKAEGDYNELERALRERGRPVYHGRTGEPLPGEDLTELKVQAEGARRALNDEIDNLTAREKEYGLYEPLGGSPYEVVTGVMDFKDVNKLRWMENYAERIHQVPYAPGKGPTGTVHRPDMTTDLIGRPDYYESAGLHQDLRDIAKELALLEVRLDELRNLPQGPQRGPVADFAAGEALDPTTGNVAGTGRKPRHEDYSASVAIEELTGEISYAKLRYQRRLNELSLEGTERAIKLLEDKRLALIQGTDESLRVSRTGPSKVGPELPERVAQLSKYDAGIQELRLRRERTLERMGDLDIDTIARRGDPEGRIPTEDDGMITIKDSHGAISQVPIGSVVVQVDGTAVARKQYKHLVDHGDQPAQLLIDMKSGQIWTEHPGKMYPWMRMFQNIDVAERHTAYVVGYQRITPDGEELVMSIPVTREIHMPTGQYGYAIEHAPKDLVAASRLYTSAAGAENPRMAGFPIDDRPGLRREGKHVRVVQNPGRTSEGTGGLPVATENIGGVDYPVHSQALTRDEIKIEYDTRVGDRGDYVGATEEDVWQALGGINWATATQDEIDVMVRAVRGDADVLPAAEVEYGHLPTAMKEMGAIDVEDLMSGARSIRDLPEGTSIIAQHPEGRGLAVGAAPDPPPQSYWLTRDMFEQEGPGGTLQYRGRHGWETEAETPRGQARPWRNGDAPGFIATARRAAQKMLDDGYDPDIKVAVRLSKDSHHYVEAGSAPMMTLRELAEQQLPRSSVSELYKLADEVGLRVQMNPNGSVTLYTLTGQNRHRALGETFKESLEAREFLEGVVRPPKNAEELTDQAGYYLRMGTQTDAEVDSTKFAATATQEEAMKQVARGDIAVTEVMTGDEGAFVKTFSLLDESSGIHQQDLPNPVLTGEYQNVTYVKLDEQMGIEVPHPGARMAIINRPQVQALLKTATVQRALKRLEIDPSGSVSEIVLKLDKHPHGLNILAGVDADSAAMYSFQRAKGMTNHYRKDGRVIRAAPDGKRHRIYSDAEKQEWETNGMWNPCKL